MKKLHIRTAAVVAAIAVAFGLSAGAAPALAQEYYGWTAGKNCGTEGFPYTSTQTRAVHDESQLKRYGSTTIDKQTWWNHTGASQTHTNYTSFSRAEWAFVRTDTGTYTSRKLECDR